jgi:hypothetical protein
MVEFWGGKGKFITKLFCGPGGAERPCAKRSGGVRNFEKWDFEWKGVELNCEQFGVGERLRRRVASAELRMEVGEFV